MLKYIFSTIFSVLLTTVVFTQNGQFDLRFSLSCTNDEVFINDQLFVDIEIKASSAATTFELGNQNYRMSFNRDAVANPFIAEELDVSGFIQTQTGYALYNTHNMTGSADTLISYNIDLLSSDGLELSATDWTSVGRIGFDVLDPNECLEIKWHQAGMFPPIVINEVFNNSLPEAAEGTIENLDACFSDLTCDTECTDYQFLYNGAFERGWYIWNDGGTDARRSSLDAQYAIGDYCVRLRDNTSTSVTTTDNLDFSAYNELRIDFSYLGRSMEPGEDFWLQISTDGGASFSTEATWASGTDFQNLSREYEEVFISGPFTANTKIRFRCDASGDWDYVYLDNIRIYACSNGNFVAPDFTEPLFKEIEPEIETEEITTQISDVKVFPNPANDFLNIEYETSDFAAVQINLIDLNGRVVQQKLLDETTGQQITQMDIGQLSAGFYFVQLVSEDSMVYKKIVKK